MGNSLLDIIVFGRNAGKAAAAKCKEVELSRIMEAADTSLVSRGCINASPSALISIAPSERTFSVTSAPKICAG